MTEVGHPFTKADLETMPDDGRRYEIVDGTLIVSPAPARRHQIVQANLAALLLERRPDHQRVLLAPVDVELAPDTVVEPDLLVVDKAEFAELDRPVTPLLAVEILSPSTRLIDLHVKRARLERSGCPRYWVVDPEVPSVTAWVLRDGAYVEEASAAGEEACHLRAPYDVTVVPAGLLR